VEKVVMGMCMEGLLDKEEEEALREAIEQLLSHELIAPLFDNKVQVITAHDIICKKALSLQSPDRVVVAGNKISIINFVSGTPTETDIRSLSRYARYLTKMGYEFIDKLIVCTEDRNAIKV
jgi:hypothetical protein